MTDPLSSESSPASPPAAPSAVTILAQYAEQNARRAQLRPTNKAALFDALAAAGVTHVLVVFDGCGDSGQVEAVTARTGEQPAALPTGDIEFLSARWGEPAPEMQTLTVAAAIESLAYDFLSEVASGWENNDGAYGEFTFDVGERTITLDYNERHMESDNTQFEF
jgi:hypothetical protein